MIRSPKTFSSRNTNALRASDEINALKQRNNTELNTLRESEDAKRMRLSEESHKAYEERRAAVDAETQKTTASLDAKQKRIVGDHAQAANKLAHESNRQLETMRADTAKKLAAYQERQSDPFYRMVTLDAVMSEDNDRYVFTAKIPEFEQREVKATISGSQLIISGTRRNEEKLELAPGRTQSTNAYQAFSEAFPLPQPVDARRLSREADGDRLTITIPKKKICFRGTPGPAEGGTREARTAPLSGKPSVRLRPRDCRVGRAGARACEWSVARNFGRQGPRLGSPDLRTSFKNAVVPSPIRTRGFRAAGAFYRPLLKRRLSYSSCESSSSSFNMKRRRECRSCRD